MMDVIKNGLRQNLIFKGALHLSFVDKKVNDYDKLVINVNKNKDGDKIWVDMISIYGMLGECWENFRIGGNVDGSLRGHQDLVNWLEMCMKELDWQGSISCLNKDALILGIFNFINGVSDVILTSDTQFKLENEDGFVIKTFYPWPDDDPEDFNDDEEEIVEEVVEEVVDEEVVDEEVVEETTEEIIDFKGYEFKCNHEKGIQNRSDVYYNNKVKSTLFVVVETDKDGLDHVVGTDIMRASYSVYGGEVRVKAVYKLEDVQKAREDIAYIIDKIIEASGIYLDSEKIIAKEVLLLDINFLLNNIEEGLKWKASLNSDDAE